MCQEPSAASVHTYGSLRRRGLSRSALGRALAAGEMRRLRVGVYASSDACPDAARAASHGGAMACLTAARHLGIWVMGDDRCHVWLGRDGREHHADGCGCVVHWENGTRTAFAMPPVWHILWQVRRCAGVESFFVALESALRRGLLRRADHRALLSHLDRAGRDAADFARRDADSGLESLLRFRLRRHGLTVRTQVDVDGVGRVDFLIGSRLLVEVDGRDNHEGPSMRHKDLVRDANAAMWGYITLRFDYALIVHEWDLVERAILGALPTAS